MLSLALFILGAHIGSFLNVCIWRLPRGESVVAPPSHCPKCDTRLKALDLVPLLSQVFLRARCRYCGAKISWRYFGIEFLTGVLFVLAGTQSVSIADGMWQGDVLVLLRGLIFMACLVVIFWIDYDTFLIQLEAVFLLGLAGVALDIWQISQNQKALSHGDLIGGAQLLAVPLPASLLAMVVAATGLWIVREAFSWLYKREALGFGDVILVAAIAANLGWHATLLTFFFLSVVVGAFIGVALKIPRAVRAFLWARRRENRLREQKVQKSSEKSLAWPLARHAFRKAIPFGPMLAVGAIIALLFGEQINRSYLQQFDVGPAATFPATFQAPPVLPP